MQRLKHNKWLIWCALGWVFVLVLQRFPAFIERWYSLGIYPIISQMQRWLLGWVPFSVGDLLYMVVAVAAMYQIFRLGRLATKRQLGKQQWLQAGRWFVKGATILYVWFHVGWGLNYYRLGSSYQLQLAPNAYTTADVDTLARVLNQRLQQLCADTLAIESGYQSGRVAMTMEAVKSYSLLASKYPFLGYRHQSIKPTFMGRGINYFGILGYANPFTGEAQMNNHMPIYLRSYTLCHEMAHQLGYASETEANLVGYLACRASGSATFAYSAYASLQAYALGDLYQADSSMARVQILQTPAYLKRERQRERAFFATFKNPIEPLFYAVYERYLKANNQPLGHKSYNYVVAWLIAYGKKYGWESL